MSSFVLARLWGPLYTWYDFSYTNVYMVYVYKWEVGSGTVETRS